MRHRTNTLAGLAAGVMLLSACRGTAPAATPTATATTSTPTASASPTPVAAPVITSTTAAQLHATGSFSATQVQRLGWSASGTLWVVSTTRIDAVAPTTGALTKVYEVQSPDRILALSPAGIAAVTSGAQGTPVRLVDIATSKTTQTLATDGITNAASFFGTKAALVSGDTIGATIWDITSGAKTGTLSGFQTAAPVYNVTISPDGARDAWVSRATVQFGDVNANTLGARIQLDDFAGAYAFAPDGNSFATATGVQGTGNAIAGRVQLWDPGTGKEIRRFDQSALFGAVAFAPKEHLIATGGDGFTVWSTDDGKSVGSASVGDAGKVRQIAVSPDGTSIATVADDGSGKIWRATAH